MSLKETSKYVLYNGERLEYKADFYGKQVLWITDPSQINMEHMQFVGGYPNEYCIYLEDLSEEDREEILSQLK